MTHFARCLVPVLAATALGVLSLHAGAQSKWTYSLRPDPSIAAGQPELTTGSRVPLNKRYEAFSPEERAALHSMWEGIAPGDEPPFPLNGLRPIHEAFYKAQTKLRAEGLLTLIANVSPTGEVTEVTTLGSPSPEMTQFAAQVMFLTKFKPAKCGAQACSMQYPIRFEFR
jgi:hypothetical protein